jgi:serine protease Do
MRVTPLPRHSAIAAFSSALFLWLSASPSPALGGLPETIERVKPSIVAVGTFQKTRSPAFAFRGTGFVVGDGTLIVTNAHVLPETVQDERGEILIVLAAGGNGQASQARDAKVIDIDKDHDLALLRVAGSRLPALSIGDSDRAREGIRVAFTGFPIGSALGFVPVTHRGIISALTPIVLPAPTSQQLDARAIRRTKSGAFVVFQLDATAYPGNSGSPLYDDETGEVIGIINMVFVKGTKEAALSTPTGISFAIPAKYLDALVKQRGGGAVR